MGEGSWREIPGCLWVSIPGVTTALEASVGSPETPQGGAVTGNSGPGEGGAPQVSAK
jgi:hypothetical protein